MPDLKSLTKSNAPLAHQPPVQKHVWRWQWLLAPLLGISAGLHIALLFIPLPEWAPTEQEEPEALPPETENAPIDILSLSEIAAPPPPEPPPSAPPPQPPQPAPAPTGAARPPVPTQATEPSEPEEEEAFFEDEQSDELLSDDSSAEENTSAFDVSVATQQFVGNLTGLGVNDFTADLGLPQSDNFREPGNASCFIDPATGGPVANAREARWLDKEPQALLQENLPATYGPSDITFNELENFCGERYFEAIAAEGQTFMKFSLVQMQGSTLLVLWANPPQ